MTILIRDGVYPVASTSWYPYITASNLVIRSLSGDRDAVIITGQGMKSVAPKVEIGLYAVGDSITIADLTIREVGNHGIAATGEFLFVHNVRIQDTYEQMIKGTSGDNGSDSSIVQCSFFQYRAGIGPQFYIGGLDIHDGDGWIVRDNYFEDIASPSSSVAEHAIHFWNKSSNNLVERNWIVNCDRGIGFGLGSSRSDGGMIRNNIIYNNGSDPFDDVGIGLETSPGTRVYNNTVFIEYPNAIEYRFAETKNVFITNNLTNKTIKLRNGAQASLAANITDAKSSWFVNTTKGNLRLASAQSTVIGKGLDLGLDVPDDIDQNLRNGNVKYDIGAHQFRLVNVPSIEKSEISIYPNPANDFIRVDGLKSESTFKIFALESKGVKTGTISISDPRIEVQDILPGTYILEIRNTLGELVHRKTVILI